MLDYSKCQQLESNVDHSDSDRDVSCLIASVFSSIPREMVLFPSGSQRYLQYTTIRSKTDVVVVFAQRYYINEASLTKESKTLSKNLI